MAQHCFLAGVVSPLLFFPPALALVFPLPHFLLTLLPLALALSLHSILLTSLPNAHPLIPYFRPSNQTHPSYFRNHAAVALTLSPSCRRLPPPGRDAAGQLSAHEHPRPGGRQLGVARRRQRRVGAAGGGGERAAEDGARVRPPAARGAPGARVMGRMRAGCVTGRVA